MLQLPDAPEIARCKRGDEEGFRRLFDTYRSYVYALCFSIVSDREEALDACQEVFLTVFRGMKSVRDDAPLKPWLRQVTVNVCLNYRESSRSGARSVPVDEDSLEEATHGRFIGSVGPDPAKAAEDGEVREAIRGAVAGLHADQKLAVVLFHQEGLTYEEISEATGWPLGTVKTNLFRGRKEMGKQLRTLVGGDRGA